MKLKVINFDSKNVFGSIKQAVFTSALSYAKMYELLHKQIWRKAPYRIAIATFSSMPTFNDRPVGFVRKWNIKSPSRSAYSYDGGDHTFGLNQLFVGQDYRKEYQGDPKSGIYHDDCYIQPKSITTSATQNFKHAWVYYTNEEDSEYSSFIHKNYVPSKIWYKEDDNGYDVIANVTIDYYISENVHYRRIVITYTDTSMSYIELGSYNPTTFLGDGIEYGACISRKTPFGYKVWYNVGTSFDEHGSIVEQYSLEEHPFYDTILWMTTTSGWVRVYEDGTVIKFTPEYESSGESTDYYPASYKILPMIYLDTGDLAMDRIEFVDKWDTYFELIVHEDSEWWTGLVKPVSLIVAAVIIYLSWGSLSSPIAKAIVLIGYAVYAAGVITNNTDLMLIGGIMMAGVSIYTAVEAATTTTVATSAQLSTMSTEQVLATTSFSETFSGYASAAGMENLLVMPTVESYTSLTLDGLVATSAPYAELGAQAGMSVADYVSLSGANAFSIDSLMSIGKELYSAYNNTNQLLKKNTTSSSKTSDTSDDSGVRITIKSSDEEDDVMQYIKKVIDIL